MWEHRGCIGSVWQNAWTRCGYLDCGNGRVCTNWTFGRFLEDLQWNASFGDETWLGIFTAILPACAKSIAFQKGMYVHQKQLKIVY